MATENEKRYETEGIDGKDVLWYPEIHTLDDVMENLGSWDIVRVVEGYMVDENEALENGEILKIHGERKMKNILASDQFDREYKIPIECVQKMVIRTFSDGIYNTVRDISNATNLPRMVENTKLFKFYGEDYDIGTQFEIKSIFRELEKPKGLSVISVFPRSRRLTLPLSVRGDFREVIMPQDRNKEYLIKDLEHRQFPICVGFLPTREKVSLYGPHLGRVWLKGTLEEDRIYATVYYQGGSFYKTFLRNLDIALNTGKFVKRSIYNDIDGPGYEVPPVIRDLPENGIYVPMTSKTLPRDKSVHAGIKAANVATLQRKKVSNNRPQPEKATGWRYQIRNEKNNNDDNVKEGGLHSSLWLDNQNEKSIIKTGRTENEYKKDFTLPTNAVVSPTVENATNAEDISDILNGLQLDKYVNAFKEQQIDAELIKTFGEEHFTAAELNMTPFEATKLSMYTKGWRPISMMLCERSCKVAKDAEEPEFWTVEEVGRRMMSIRLNSFAEFCMKNQVDGKLLKNISNVHILESLEATHEVVLSPIEERKLQSYVIDGWRPQN